MFIVRVVPIARGIFKDELSFFSREALSAGFLVSATVRGRSVPSLVISSTDARQEKADLKSADFALKKISLTNAKQVFTRAFVGAIADSAFWHGIHEGVMLAALTSQAILTAPAKLVRIREAEKSARGETVRPRADLLVLQAEKNERVRTYRNLAREAFARGSSLLILSPTVIEAETLAQELGRGIEERVFLFTSEVPKKKLVDTWNHAVAFPEPVLIIGTAFCLSVPRADVGTIIVERESARAYRSIQRPHADARRVAEFLARRTGARLILADFPLRVETRFRADTGEMEELARPQVRPAATLNTQIVDVRKKDETKELGGERGIRRVFKSVSDGTIAAIREEIARGGRAAVFAARRGIAPLTVCNDCGTPVTDKETETPMVLHRTPEGNVFLSHRSGAILPAGAACRICGGWNLVTLGIGVERVFEELQKAFPDAPISLFTKDTTPTHKSAKKTAEAFYDLKGSIMVGTERMLPYLTEPVELAVVASVDSFLSLPAWRSHEHTLSILFYLRERSELSFIIETRKPEHLVMKTLMSGNPADFYRADIEERARYQYPPFSVFIGLSWRGTRASVEKGRLLVSELFADTDLVGPLPAVSEGKNEWSARAVIRTPKGLWPDAELAERLKQLPPGIAITIDPDEIA
ncbi:hypothetical protein HY090_00485 [Candidatus Kaiserbacteria bacterium]|nr:hypothetical protein [Candidatus Kaiserbacteria bacterium]